jgi:hypothetical protein
LAKAYLTVRAEVRQADRDRFDRWYETDHLPWALRVFGARRAWRCWSKTEPGAHIAFYEFDSVEAAEAIQKSDAIKPLVADFDRVWQDRVARRREVLEVMQEIEPQ